MEPDPENGHFAAALARLRGIGANDALLLDAELLCRDFRNRRELAGLAGLAPVPRASGGVDQGIGKAGSPMLRRHLVPMAWRCRNGSGSMSAPATGGRKRGIVALARKLPAAPWRYATAGPERRRTTKRRDTRAARRGLRGTRARRVTGEKPGSPPANRTG